MRALAAALLATVATPAFADAIVDNVNGVVLDRNQRVVRFKALILDKEGKVVRLVPPGEQIYPAGAELEALLTGPLAP